MKERTKFDPYTGESFQAKRRNQVFATAQNRIDFHNEKAAQVRTEKEPINNALHKNRQILQSLLQDKEVAIYHRQFLLGAGFSFRQCTHFDKYEDRKAYGVFEYLWIREMDEQGQLTENVKIIRNARPI